MTLVAATNLTSPAGLVYASSDTDVIDRQTQVAGWMQALDAHDHTLTKGAAVGRLNTATTVADPTVSGNPNVRINGDDFTWWANTTAAIFTAVNTTNAQTVGGAKTFSAAATFSAGATVSSGGIAVTGNSTITGTLGSLTGLTVASGLSTFPAGSAAAPSVVFSGATTTGLWSPGAATLAFSTGGAERVRVDSSGRVGIGATPAALGSGHRGVQIGAQGWLFSDAAAGVGANHWLTENIYYDGTNWKYITTDAASLFQVGASGQILFHTAASGTAGANATIVNTWKITSAGHLLAGTDNAYDIGASGATRPRTGYFGTSLVVGTNPATTGAIRLPNNNPIYWRNAANSGDLLGVNMNSSNELTLSATGLLALGSGLYVVGATGGDKGAGTINVSSAIYLNGTAYTNPDYVFENWLTGNIVKNADEPGAATYAGWRPLGEVERYAREHWHLPGLSRDDDLFRRAAHILEKAEEAYIYLFDHEHRLAALEAKVR